MSISKVEVVIGSIGYFIVFGSILGLSGLGGVQLSIPADVNAADDDVEQGWVVTTLECIWSLYQDCLRTTVTDSFNAVSNVVAFASSYVGFFFQLLTFQLPELPGWLNSIIVLPPAVGLMYVGITMMRGGS